MNTTTVPAWVPMVRELMSAQRKNQAWLAAECYVTRQHMSRLLSGQRATSPGILALIAHALGVPVAWLDRI